MQPNRARYFESIESTLEFLALLENTVGDAEREVAALLEEKGHGATERRTEALRLAHQKFSQLSGHIDKSQRLVNDLGILRRLLFSGAEGPRG
jgi:hypothetical protein